MKLQEQLDQIRNGSKKRFPEEAKAIMRNATEILVKSGQVDKALSSGSVASDFVLQDTDGTTWDTQVLRKDGPFILTFFRGHW